MQWFWRFLLRGLIVQKWKANCLEIGRRMTIQIPRMDFALDLEIATGCWSVFLASSITESFYWPSHKYSRLAGWSAVSLYVTSLNWCSTELTFATHSLLDFVIALINIGILWQLRGHSQNGNHFSNELRASIMNSVFSTSFDSTSTSGSTPRWMEGGAQSVSVSMCICWESFASPSKNTILSLLQTLASIGESGENARIHHFYIYSTTSIHSGSFYIQSTMSIYSLRFCIHSTMLIHSGSSYIHYSFWNFDAAIAAHLRH